MQGFLADAQPGYYLACIPSGSSSLESIFKDRHRREQASYSSCEIRTQIKIYRPLELALAQTRERLIASTQALALINPALPALAFGQPDAVVQVEIPTTVLVNEQGRIVEQCDGCSITWLAKRYGFGTGRKATEQCKAWLASLGIKDGDWVEEMSAHTTRKLPRQMLPFLDRQFFGRGGDRQRYIGEVN